MYSRSVSYSYIDKTIYEFVDVYIGVSNYRNRMDKKQEKYYQKLVDIAKSKGGKVISELYMGAKVHMTFECDKSHNWDTTPDTIKRGSWCGVCYKKEFGKRSRIRPTIEILRNTAWEKGGQCLSKIYTNNTEKLLWKCAVKDHPEFLMTWNKVQQRQWCKLCGRIEAANKFRTDITILHQAAKERNGILLSPVYINNETKLEWKCHREDHPSFWMTWDAISSQQQWCKKCGLEESGRKKRVDICKLIRKAEAKGGDLVAIYYKNGCAQGIWKCADSNHPPFHATWGSVSQNQWCSKCANHCPIQAKERFEKKVKEKGGAILGIYVNTFTKIELQCSKGHKWNVVPSSVTTNGSWCPNCERSKGEEIIANFLNNEGIHFIQQYRMKCIPSLRYDFYVSYEGISYLVEYDGKQHFHEDCNFGHITNDFEHRQNLDRLKTYIAIETGYKLIRIDYTQFDNIEEHILTGLQSSDNYYLSSKDLYRYLTDDEIPDKIFDKYVKQDLFEEMRII